MSTNSKKKDQSIQAYIRLKPILTKQESIFTSVSLTSLTTKMQQVYNFNQVFNDESTNKDIFQVIAQPLIKHSIQGYNACILAYGQTSSGKTFTMKGSEDDDGIIPLTLGSLLRTIEEKQLVAQVKISYIQIYNENIIDLLEKEKEERYLDLREDCRKNITISNLTEHRISNIEEAKKLFNQGQLRRKFANNNVNMASSRSHTIFRINIEVVHENFTKTSSCINMVDLAGSEGVSRTKAEGNAKKEGENINRSILALSNVIRGMSAKESYVNYRDSKLTRILQSSLCSNSRSAVICTVNPTDSNYQESINTMKFGETASHISIEIKKNVSNNGSNSINNNSNSLYNSQMSQQTQAKSVADQRQEALQPQQRIQFQQNKRVIAQLRQQNQQLKNHKRAVNEKVEFMELQNHRLGMRVSQLQELLNCRKARESPMDFNNEEREELKKQITTLKGDLQMASYRYEALNECLSKVQNNQRFLLDKIAKYQKQISVVNQQAETSIKQIEKSKSAIKVKPVFMPKKQFKQVCPLTIASIITLKAEIIGMKQHIYAQNQEIAELIDQRNQLVGQLQGTLDQNSINKVENFNENISDAQKKQIKSLHLKIKKLKTELHIGKNREIKLTKMLKECSVKWIEEFDEFNEWYIEKRKRIDEINRREEEQRYSEIERENYQQNY